MNKFIIFFIIYINFIFANPSYWIQNNIIKAGEVAKKQKKPILIDFFSKDCYYCLVLEKEVYSSKEFRDWKDKFILVRIDGDNFPDLADEFQISGYPSTIILDYNQVEIGRIDGYLSKLDFLERLSYYYKNKDLLEELEKKIQKDPENYYNYFQLGIYYDKAKNLNKSEEYLLKALYFLKPNQQNYYQNKKNLLYNLAVQNTKLENYKKAYSYWNAFLSWIKEEDYDYPYAKYYRAMTFLKFQNNLNSEEKKKIIKDLEFVIQKLPNTYEKEEAKKLLFKLKK